MVKHMFIIVCVIIVMVFLKKTIGMISRTRFFSIGIMGVNTIAKTYTAIILSTLFYPSLIFASSCTVFYPDALCIHRETGEWKKSLSLAVWMH